ncbi:hypothetical protein ABIA35_009091 [Catenulispora sp. MAP12-49]|uniref:hypothetical protein n=1 Tax=Catenulispora sp. MAP12-49 TaxID=3156302 RepID=UPI003517AA27
MSKAAARPTDVIMGGMAYDKAVAESGNTRVLGAPWQCWKSNGGSEALTRYLPEAVVSRYLDRGCGLTADQQRTHLAIHEAGHTFAMHAVGMAYGKIVINSSAELLEGRTDLHRLAHAEWRELPRTAREVALLALGGWVAAETWLELTTVNGRRLREDPLNVCHAQITAADDHYDLMCFPTPRPTAYLYGNVQEPGDWEGDVIAIEAVRGNLIKMFLSRWPQLIELAEKASREGGATTDIIAKTLGDPGWAI